MSRGKKPRVVGAGAAAKKSSTNANGPETALCASRSRKPTLQEIIALKQAAEIAAPLAMVKREQFFRPRLSALHDFGEWLQKTVFARSTRIEHGARPQSMRRDFQHAPRQFQNRGVAKRRAKGELGDGSTKRFALFGGPILDQIPGGVE